MIKLEIKEFTNVKLKIDKKSNGDLYIDFTPIIKHANKLVKQKLKEVQSAEVVKLRRAYRKLHWKYTRLQDDKSR